MVSALVAALVAASDILDKAVGAAFSTLTAKPALAGHDETLQRSIPLAVSAGTNESDINRRTNDG